MNSVTSTATVTYHDVCATSDLDPTRPAAFTIGHTPVVVVVHEGSYYALYDECSHQQVRLSEGETEDGRIECWLHGSQFDLATGASCNLPATEPVQTYPTRVVNNRVEVGLPLANSAPAQKEPHS